MTWPRLAAEMGDEPKEQRQCGAKEERSDEREVERGVFAAMNDVPGETAEAEREFTTEIKKCADEYEEGAEDEEGAAKFAEGIHGESLEERRCRCNEGRTVVADENDEKRWHESQRYTVAARPTWRTASEGGPYKSKSRLEAGATLKKVGPG